ncbi:MAG: O-antigen ligase family protein [Aphanizomenon sp.]|jgi:O-antigen ligase|uniref:Polymerase n=1 Tax=Aphanizomenon flos-aquae LD13 TaxID=1710894 RepID=A0A1B7VY08_APHFL|nr:O-antigen ligase family protein [Aphanizomenon flos-aquae UKL13-PB]MBO1061181.1 O-antigen ligase family protein [Aphanizomenon flos-aquae CP01]OBQ25765.1 MAG: polymerase [Aphanizomenon flos-aquae LD13]OBQ30835.1 MAG: polymerase [Aphanizomenon flos-aquae MDT14a]HCQ20099.1 polymerase [Anabaena sp. UBA12330]
MLGNRLNKTFYHPSSRLQTPWNWLQFGLLSFPLSPFMGGISIVMASLLTWRKQHQIISQNPIHKGFAILSILLLITSGFAPHKLDAFLGLFNLLPFFFFFTGLTPLIQTPAQLRQISWIMVFGSVPILIIGFGQLFLGWNFQFQFLWIVFDWIVAPEKSLSGRMASNFMHPNTLAAYLLTIFILGLGLWLENYHKLKQKNPLIIFLTITVFANFIALILTNSRNGWGITIFTCLAYALYRGWRLIVTVVVSITSCFFLAAFAPSPIAQFFRLFVPYGIWARLNDDMFPDRPVGLMRKTQWEFAWNLTQQHPLTGSGLRSFGGLYKNQIQIDVNHPHNLFLMLSAETGLITTLLFCGLLISILITASQLLWKSKSIEPENRLIFFSYLITFIGWILFNTVDVTTFDIRLNTLSWVFVGSLCGVMYQYALSLQSKNAIKN